VRGIDVSKVSYWIEQDTKRAIHGLVRERPRELAPPSGPVHREEDVTEVAPEVVYINFRFYDNGQWTDTWDSTQTGSCPRPSCHGPLRGDGATRRSSRPFMTRFVLPGGGETHEKAQ
jgi:hypothetical protein